MNGPECFPALQSTERRRRSASRWHLGVALLGVSLSRCGAIENCRPRTAYFSPHAVRSPAFSLPTILQLRAGTSQDSSEKQVEEDTKPQETVPATDTHQSPLEAAAATTEVTETEPIIQSPDNTEKEDDMVTNDKYDADTQQTPSSSVDVPSLDTFMNYDEEADALSSMAPVLETTTINVLDGVTAHEKETPDNDLDEVESSEEEEMLEPPVETESEEPFVVDESLTLEQAQEQSAAMRLQGKKLHDQADFKAAAVAFARAALVVESFVDQSTECAEDWSTCRLHEALCHLKADESAAAVKACTKVLDRPFTSGAIRARALYRRAKAYTELGESDLALTDARGAAFLGDRRGVALYGQLMRESPANVGSFLSSSSSSSNNNQMMDDLASSTALFESLLNKSSPGQQDNRQSDDALPPFNPLSLLSGMGGAPSPLPKTGLDSGGLAKSVIASLSKRLEDEATQDTICKYLQKTSGPQIQQYAGMAGMELPESQASRIANFLRGVTPKGIRRTVKNGKRIVYGVQLMRKISKVIVKYRSVLIWICLLGWIKSALLRPIPVNKRMARLAAKQAKKK